MLNKLKKRPTMELKKYRTCRMDVVFDIPKIVWICTLLFTDNSDLNYLSVAVYFLKPSYRTLSIE